MEHKIEKRILSTGSASSVQVCQNCKVEFMIEPEDFNFYKKIDVPPPTFCPECRLIRRLNWQSFTKLYKKECASSGDILITTTHPDSPYKIYRQDIWWGDSWDPKSYGRDYDFSKPFFEQLKELYYEVPLPSLYSAYSTMKNSDYCNAASDCKNCYLVFRVTGAEDSAYSSTVVGLKSSLDVLYVNHSELCYEVIRTNNSFKVFYSQYCQDCFDVYFSSDMVGCSNCVGCINLVNKNYCIFNQQYSKEEYEKRFKEFDWSTRKNVKDFRKKAYNFMLTQPRKNFRNRNNKNVSGDYILNSKNVRDSYMVENGENCRYCHFTKEGPITNCYDYSLFGDNSELIYDAAWIGLNAYNVKFSSWNYYAHDIEYCFGCHGSGNLFGCIGIRKGEYCILNKQYTKKEYEELIPKIKKHIVSMPYKDKKNREYRYGCMMPADFSPWAYNDSLAQDLFPLNEKEAVLRGFQWSEEDNKEYKEPSVNLPDRSIDVSNDFINEVLKCEGCGRNYRIVKLELQFYKRFNIPIPSLCFFCRDRNRTNLLNPIKIYHRKCDKCGKDIETSYAPERPEIVYCEECYNKEVY